MHPRGYLALWRKVQDHPFWKEHRVWSKYEAWIDILMEAQHEEDPKEVILGMTTLICNYGECLKSVVTWSRRWNWSRSKVERYFKLLKKMGQISLKSEGITSRLTVINYSCYDPRRGTNEHRPSRDRAGTEQGPSTDNKVNNVKNVKNVKNSNLTVTCQPDEPADDKPPKNNRPQCPQIKIVELYHEICPELPHQKIWDAAAKAQLRARWNEDKERQSIDWWFGFFTAAVKTSDLLMGRAKPWRADLRWIVKAGNFAKIINGNYVNRGTGHRRTDKNQQAIQSFIDKERAKHNASR